MGIQIVISYPEKKTLWRVLHELELPRDKRIAIQPGRPEVRAMFPNHFVPFNRAWQELSYKANQPWLTPRKWDAFYGNNLWITNDNGFGEEDDPRVNFITGENVGAPLPKVEAITCGGNVLAGYEEGENVVIETLDYTESPPSAEWLLSHREFCTYAVTVDSGLKPRRFPQGEQPDGFMPDLLHPLMADPKRFKKITIPKWRVVRWTENSPPDLYKIYRPA